MKMSRTVQRVAIVILLALSSLTLHAVNVNGRIKGSVTDPAGAVVPGATVTATNQKTGIVFKTSTLSDGGYYFGQLPIGTYTISAMASGFKAFSASGIVVNIDQDYVEPIKLDVGSATETVAVQADPVQVNTTESQLNNYVGAQQFVELPLIGRSFTGLELILPGVQSSNDRFGTYSVNGSQTQQSAYLINGADSNDLPVNTLGITPNLDALQQFNLTTGSLNAEYDRNSGAIVNTAIKAGTNQIHGDAFEFYRDTFLNTRNFFQQTAPIYHQNIYGGTIGGPILKDKIFLFAAYQGTRARQPQAGGNVNVPSAAQLGGDFSSIKFSNNLVPSTLNIPGCTAASTFAQCLGPGSPNNGHLPSSAVNPISAALIKQYVPSANSGSNGYVFNPITTSKQDQILGRVDYNFNTKNQFTFVGIYQTSPSADVLPFTGATLPGFGDQGLSHIQQYTADYTRQLSNTAVNDFALHYTRFNLALVSPQNVVAPSSLGFNINPQDTANQSVPYIAIQGYFALGFSTNGPQPRIDSNYGIDENITKTFGHHNIKVGYDGQRYNVSNPFDASNNGAFGFSILNNPDTSGNPLLDFLIGAPATYNQNSGAKIIATAFLNYFYAQDTWRVSDNLTLNYGLGYQIDTPLANHQYGGEAIICYIPGEQSKIFPTAFKNLAYPGDPGCNNAGGAKTVYSDLGPRLGFAYTPQLGFLSGGDQKKLSIYGGYGIYYNRSEEETALQNLADAPFGLNSHGAGDLGATNPQFANPFADLNGVHSGPNRFPFQFPAPGANINFENYAPLGLSGIAPNFRSPSSQNFNLTMERELPSQVVLRLSYVGTLGRHNQVTIEANPETAAGQAACLADPTCIANASIQSYLYPLHTAYGYPDPQQGGGSDIYAVGQVSTEGSSNYNALQASVEKGLTHGLYMQVSYTYSHAMDDGSSFENSGFGGTSRGYNEFVKSLNYGDSAFDARHRLVISPIYEVPFQRGGNAFYNVLAAGWEVSGIATFAGGFPYDISYGGGSSNSLFCSSVTSYYACPDVPQQVAPLVRNNPRIKQADGGTNWFYGETTDVTPGASFAQEPIGSFGNVHRNPFHGPGTNNTNMIVAKNFPLSKDGSRTLQLRMESDNVFNHTQFNNPDGNIGDGAPSVGGTFGQIFSAASGRNTQIAAKIYF